MQLIDLTGQRFGRLTVVGLDHIDRAAVWKCRCDCGNETVVVAPRLRFGRTKSCGCLRRLLNADQEKNICVRYQSGESSKLLAQEYGVSCPTIRRVLNRHGISVARELRMPKPNLQRYRRILSLRTKGKTFAEIGELLNLTPSGVHRILTRTKSKVKRIAMAQA